MLTHAHNRMNGGHWGRRARLRSEVVAKDSQQNEQESNHRFLHEESTWESSANLVLQGEYELLDKTADEHRMEFQGFQQEESKMNTTLLYLQDSTLKFQSFQFGDRSPIRYEF